MLQNRPRSTSVTFIRSRTSSRPDDIPEFRSDDEDIQITLAAPYIQTYLAYNSRGVTCCGISLPILFERAASTSWWNPRFDSDILEGQYKLSAFNHLRLRFRYALFYILFVCITWFIYFLYNGLTYNDTNNNHRWTIQCSIIGILSTIILSILYLTHMEFYRLHMTFTSFFVAIILCTISILSIYFTPITIYDNNNDHIGFIVTDMSSVAHFAICIEILLLIYTVIPLPLYLCVTITLIYSILFETLTFMLMLDSYLPTYRLQIGLLVRCILQFSIHLIGFHIFIMTNVRMRGTFMKVGQSLLVRRQLEMEKQLKEKMIHSVMPPKVADWLMSETGDFESNDVTTNNNALPRNSNPGASDLKSLFRPFNMNRMENVSILFADIVGFTKMSSNKSAEELVGILNDLFERFDDLCSLNNCEKISTLGDCYYCVSGCPEPRPDHAKCCVEMGLGMIEAIKQFDMERNEGVNMRVGIHTGTVLCGIVGTRRFKFDVWSNDVTLANRMESTGKPGRVHISEKTCDYLQNLYILESGEPLEGLKTFFIVGRIDGNDKNEFLLPIVEPSVQLIISSPTSPQSMSPQTRPRFLSGSNQLRTIKQNPNQLSPNFFRIKANSLPSILDSDSEGDIENKDQTTDLDTSSKSPTSTSSYGKYSNRLKTWRIPKFLFRATDPIEKGKNDVDVIPQIVTDNKTETKLVSNGYQQVPTIIETSPTSTSTYHTSPKDPTSSPSPRPSICNGNNDRSKFNGDKTNDILDIKSYISQSRSDIGHFDKSPTSFIRTSSFKSNYTPSPKESVSAITSGFDRSSSYRSHHGRSSSKCDMSPVERGRSATVACRMDTECLEVPSVISAPDDQLSLCLSVNSRKDSGIKSNSRRSSIQQQIFALNQAAVSHADILQHRVSGYYTSSQSTICSSVPPHYAGSKLPPVFSDHLGACVQKLRKQSDLQLIRCVQDNTSSKRSYFIKPPLSRFTLFFKSKDMEMDYRRNVYTVSEKLGEGLPTLATARYNTYFDVLVSLIIFIIVSISIFLLYKPFTSIEWLTTFIIFFLIQICAIILCFRQMLHFSEKIFRIFSMWYIWHLNGAILISMPIILILIIYLTDIYYNILILIGILHFCNFTQLNCWMKNILAFVYAGIFLLLLNTTTSHNNCPPYCITTTTMSSLLNITFNNNTQHFLLKKIINYNNSEIYVNILLILLLVWFLNREFEISYRLSFHSNIIANRDKARVQSMKNQADWLLHNIIPKHVADQLKQCAKYSENHKNVGIIFASIVNFNEMYDESYMGGKEFLRVLNELIGDFDELLLRPEFKCVDKIKTIGSTFMAASGLNSQIRRDASNQYEHLYALIDFAVEMQKVIDEFNRDLLEFNLILRVGYNFGDVTAGVIGTTKLYYDIWGDAVNIASRMDTTGVNGRIQIGEACLGVLEQRYEFEPRGSVYVKGKDHMNVYLLVRRKNDFLEVN